MGERTADGRVSMSGGTVSCPDAASALAADPSLAFSVAAASADSGLPVDPATLDAMSENARRLAGEGTAATREGLLSVLSSASPSAALSVLAACGTLAAVLPELDAARSFSQPEMAEDKDVFFHVLRAVDAIRNEPVLRLAALLHDVGKPGTFSVDYGLSRGDDGVLSADPGRGRVRFYGHEDVGRDMAAAALRRLGFGEPTAIAVSSIVGNHMRPHRLTRGMDGAGLTNSGRGDMVAARRAIGRMVREMDVPDGDGGLLASAEDVLEHGRADILAGQAQNAAGSLAKNEAMAAIVADIRRAWAVPQAKAGNGTPLDGNAVIRALGLDPARDGATMGRVMAGLREAYTSGAVSSESEAMELAERLAGSGGNGA